MNEEIFQGQTSLHDHQQDDKLLENIQNQNDQLVFIEDRSLNLHNSILMAQISNDEKYLATIRGWRIILIYFLKNKKLIKNLQLDDKKHCIITMKFSNNSRYLLFGDNYGFLGCFDINNNYKLFYNQKLHSCSINNILSIDDEQIMTSSNDNSIIITNIKYDQQLLKIENAHNDVIEDIVFGKFKDFIISCSYNCSIKFFNKIDGKLEIEQQNAHKPIIYGVYMIQLIQNDNNLISTTVEQLRLWLIDYQSHQLIKLKEFNNKIFNFTSIFNNYKIVVVCGECIQILDKDLVIIQSINHNVKNNQLDIKTRQLDSLNFILIQHNCQLLILKKVRKLQK